MATVISTIADSDAITVSNEIINGNFDSLNTNKIETDVLDTDTSLAANSDSKIATQKAVKAYADAIIGVAASEVVKGNVEEATDAETTAGTATGGTGAKLFITPAKIVNRERYTTGPLVNSVAKTYFNMQLPFILWTGAVVNDTTTTFANWVRSSSETVILAGGNMVSFGGTGAETLTLTPVFNLSAGSDLPWTATNIIVLDFFAKLPASSTGDINMGFDSDGASSGGYTSTGHNHVYFSQSAAGVLYANISKNGVGNSATSIASGITTTNWNHYRIEITLSTEARFYVNGTLKATMSGTNFPTTGGTIYISFGRSNTGSYVVTAPNFSIQLI